jgi:hypothetical protein
VLQEERFFDSKGELQAIFIPAALSFKGVKFLTEDKNDFQIGLMTRDLDSPVKNHRHSKRNRLITSTQEFLLIRKGKAELYLYNDNNTLSSFKKLDSGDSILLISGAHEITFSEETEILEVKQGPYISILDKVYLESND